MGIQYNKKFVDEVLQRTDIVSLINEFTSLEQHGEFYIGNCVFHKDEQQSLVVYPKEQLFHCIDCGEAGTAAWFLAKVRQTTFDRAVEELAKRCGLTPTNDDIQKNMDVARRRLYMICDEAAKFYSAKLDSADGADAKKYLDKRQLTDKTISDFRLGYSPAKGNLLYKYLKNQGFSVNEMVAAGLVKVSETGPYDMFRNRLMFPIIDNYNRVIAFGGRVLNDEDKPKYLNSPETLIFNKSGILYGIHDLEKNNTNYLIMCEGNLDVISLHQAGFKNSVATLGTAFTRNHIPTIQAHTKNLVLSYDSDDAGKKAAVRTINVLNGTGMGIRVASLAPYKDPDDLIKGAGKELFKTKIMSSVDKMDFQLSYFASQYDLQNPAEKELFIEQAIDTLMKYQELEQSLER